MFVLLLMPTALGLCTHVECLKDKGSRAIYFTDVLVLKHLELIFVSLLRGGKRLGNLSEERGSKNVNE